MKQGPSFLGHGPKVLRRIFLGEDGKTPGNTTSRDLFRGAGYGHVLHGWLCRREGKGSNVDKGSEQWAWGTLFGWLAADLLLTIWEIRAN
jgi:hypothetical protein